jgi:hypothetical protein
VGLREARKMTDPCGCTSRERLLANGREASENLRDLGQPELDGVLRTCMRVADLTFMSEAHFRAADRRRELQVEPEQEAAQLVRARRLNDAALDLLRHELPEGLGGLRRHLRSVDQGDIEPYVEVFTDMATGSLLDTGWDVYHVREGRQILTRAIDAGRSGGDAVCDQIIEKSQQLIELRERRARHNDPVGAVVASFFALSAVGLMVWASSPGGPGATNPFVLIVFATLILIAISAATSSIVFVVE